MINDLNPVAEGLLLILATVSSCIVGIMLLDWLDKKIRKLRAANKPKTQSKGNS